MGASMSTIGVALIVYCSKIDLASWAVSKFACQVMTISSQKTGLMIMSPVCTDSVMTTVALFCSSFLIYFLYFVPTYYMYFPCWCTYDLLQPCVHNRTHFFQDIEQPFLQWTGDGCTCVIMSAFAGIGPATSTASSSSSCNHFSNIKFVVRKVH